MHLHLPLPQKSVPKILVCFVLLFLTNGYSREDEKVRKVFHKAKNTFVNIHLQIVCIKVATSPGGGPL